MDNYFTKETRIINYDYIGDTVSDIVNYSWNFRIHTTNIKNEQRKDAYGNIQ